MPTVKLTGDIRLYKNKDKTKPKYSVQMYDGHHYNDCASFRSRLMAELYYNKLKKYNANLPIM